MTKHAAERCGERGICSLEVVDDVRAAAIEQRLSKVIPKWARMSSGAARYRVGGTGNLRCVKAKTNEWLAIVAVCKGLVRVVTVYGRNKPALDPSKKKRRKREYP